jgi:crooked neck
VRSLYSRLLERTNHVKVWISFAQFEASEIGGGLPAARKIFQDGYDSLKTEGLKEERVVLLEAWKAVESEATKRGEEGDVDLVIRKLPRKIKMRRMVTDDSGATPGGGKDEIEWEEYYDYHFPDDEKKIGKLLPLPPCPILPLISRLSPFLSLSSPVVWCVMS